MSAAPSSLAAQRSALRTALEACRGSFVSAGVFSLFINVLLLTPAIYMLQVYDRVLTSSSESTLLMLTLIVVFLFIVMGGLEWIRSQLLVVTSTRLDHLLGGKVFDSLFVQNLASGGRTVTAQPLSDMLQLRQFLTGPGLFAFFDAPWLPIYVLVMFMFHPVFGVAAVVSSIVLIGLAVWNELATRRDLKEANQHAVESTNHTQRNLRNAEVIEAMGMLPRIRSRWQEQQNALISLQARASRKGGLITAVSKTFRQAIQTLILGLGAYLALRREITPGVVIAGSILLGRALAPIDLLINTWRGFVGARDAYQRLDRVLRAVPADAAPMLLPPPQGEIILDRAVIAPPGAGRPVIKAISMVIEAGTVVAVIGPSAAGKSTLMRAILGIYAPASGSVRLDGAELDQWEREQLGPYLGYLPQDVELLDGTISDNIARFGLVDPQKVVAAARAAGVHEMILKLPEGYETQLIGNILSAGQRQRIGLARAVYGEPQVIVLDEPNSNLDKDGEVALAHTVASLRRAHRTVLIVTHRKNILGLVDRILLLVDGQIAAYGERDKVLAKLQQAAAQAGGVAQAAPQHVAPVG